MSGKIKLVSFADGRFKKRRSGFVREAQAIDVFDEIIVYELDMLPEDFIAQHSDFITSNSRGFGYWIWKPCIVLEEMRKADPDDVLIYLDVGFTINHPGRKRLLEYIHIVRSSPWKMLSFVNTHTEYRWTKQDLANRLGVSNDPTIMFTTQIAAGCFLLQRTSSNIELIKQWVNIAVEGDYHFSDNSQSIEKNHDQFIEHRHDASIGSLLRKIRGTTITHYEVQHYDASFNAVRDKLPMWATRSIV